eukprot:COSAG02_NODE_8786_length_2448_cov_1.467433_2_plen_73_part_00
MGGRGPQRGALQQQLLEKRVPVACRRREHSGGQPLAPGSASAVAPLAVLHPPPPLLVLLLVLVLLVLLLLAV